MCCRSFFVFLTIGEQGLKTGGQLEATFVKKNCPHPCKESSRLCCGVFLGGEGGVSFPISGVDCLLRDVRIKASPVSGAK